MKPPLNILILSDGRPGHYNLSEGIAAAIEKLVPAHTTRVDVRRGRWPGNILAALTRTPLPTGRILSAVYGITPSQLPPSDIIVSAGAETLAANVWLSRIRRAPNIFYGSLRWFDPGDFALVLTSYERNAGRRNHALALKPSRMDPDSLAPPRPTEAPDLRIGLLIGGDAPGISYHAEDWSILLHKIEATIAQTSWNWHISNSRRTPLEATRAITDLANRHPDRINFLNVEQAGPGTLASLLSSSDAILCTADSSSMISEAIWSRRPTLSIEPQTCALTTNETTYRNWLTSNLYCQTSAIARLTPQTILNDLNQVRPLTTNPQTELGSLIAARVGLLGPEQKKSPA